MNKKEIETAKVTIDEVFKDHYNVPSYQRHYVWGEDNINTLLDDLCQNMERQDNEEYFLGSYVRQKTDKTGEYDLIDGQQRITTLFLIFAVMRDFHEEKKDKELVDYCNRMVWEEGNKFKNIKPQVRLNYMIRDKAGDFILEEIAPMDATNSFAEDIRKRARNANESITVRNVCAAVETIREYFETHEVDLEKLLTFIINNVVMIYVSADSLQDAFRFFSVLNNRGMSLSNADIIKSENLQQCSDIDRYAKRWDEYQDYFGDDFDRFLSYLRTMIVKERAKVNLLDEYEKRVFSTGKISRGDEFFKAVDRAFKAYVDLFGDDKPAEIANDFRLLNMLALTRASVKNTDWVPVLLSYYIKFGNVGLADFARRLVLKMIGDWVCRLAPSTRTDNLNDILKRIDRVNRVTDLEDGLFAIDRDAFLNNITADMYGRDVVKPLLMLLDNKYQEQTMLRNIPTTLSIEHVLPQNPENGSRWMADFDEQQRQNLTHKIGNLCLIGRRKNTSLGRLDYAEKVKRYFVKNISNCPYSLHLYNTYHTWGPEDLTANQQFVVKTLAGMFGVV